jgi:hypothetical protein
MVIKKITLSFQSGFVTPLESDTLLGYIIAHCFTELQDVFETFKSKNPPFMFSNGMIEGTLPKPYLSLDIESDSTYA